MENKFSSALPLRDSFISPFQCMLLIAFLIPGSVKSKILFETGPKIEYSFPSTSPSASQIVSLNWENPCNDVPAFQPAFANETHLGVSNLPNTIRITGGITINSFQTLNLSGKTIIMDPGTSISIQSYGTLILDNCTIEGCVEMWDGIFVGSHSTMRVQNHSQINDMRYGVDPTKDAWIYFHNSLFLRNYYTLYSKNDDAFTFEFYGNTLDGSKLKPYTSPQTGQLETLASKALFGLWFESAIETQDDPIKVGNSSEAQNLIRHCETGVYAKTSDFNIENNRFLDIKTGLARAIHIESSIDHTIQNCTFDYVLGGIYAQTSYYKIKDNNFNFVRYAALARNSRGYLSQLPTIDHNTVNNSIGGFTLLFNDNSNPQIINNTFNKQGGQAVLLWDVEGMANRCNITNNTIHLKSMDDFDSGIQIIGTTKASICDNPIDYDGANVWENKGITAWLSSNSIITNNDCVQNSSAPLETNTGIQAFYLSESKLDCNYYTANNKGLHVLGSCLNTEVTTQHFLGPHTTGLLYDNATTKQQIHNGNAWDYTPAVGQKAALGVGIDQQANRFIVDPSDGMEYTPAEVDPQTWFEMQMGGNTKTCSHSTAGCTLPLPNFQNGEEEIIKKVINGQLDFPNYAACLGWMASRQALGWIIRNDLQNSTNYGEYWAENSNTSAGILAQLEFDATTSEQKLVTSDQINISWENIQNLLSINSLDQTNADLLMQNYRDLKSLNAEQISARMNFMTQYRNTLSTLPSTQVFEVNKKEVGIILCDLYARNEFECSEEELNTLRLVAAQCPFEGGDAVLQARGLLDFLKGESYNTYSGCTPIQLREAEKRIASDIHILPNPNSGTFEISFQDELTKQDWSVEIFDLIGRRCWQSAYTETIVTGVAPGVYILVCTNKIDGNKISKKLVIQK